MSENAKTNCRTIVKSSLRKLESELKGITTNLKSRQKWDLFDLGKSACILVASTGGRSSVIDKSSWVDVASRTC